MPHDDALDEVDDDRRRHPHGVRGILGLLLPCLALVFIHMLSGIQAEQPLILADELGYLGNARYLAGTAHLPDMRLTQFYHFGYSLLLLPAFWVFSDPVSTYRAAIGVNALIAACLFIPLSFVLESFLGVSRTIARWIAFTCCLYPSVVLYSNFAWSENAYILFYALAVALFGRLLLSRSTRDAVLLGLVIGFLYTIHPRGLPVLGIAGAWLLLLALLRVLPVRAVLLSIATTGGVFTLTRVVNGHLKALGWGGGGEFSAVQLGERLLPGSDFPALVDRALGQLLYLSQASHGLFLVALIGVVVLALRKVASGSARELVAEPRTGVPVFVLVTASGVFLASCTLKLYSIHGLEGVVGDNLIYGRYNEAFAVLFTAIALAELSRGRLTRRQLAVRAAAVVVAILLMTPVVALEVADAHRRHAPGTPEEVLRQGILPASVDAANVPGVFPLVGLLGRLDPYPMSLAALASFLMIILVMRLSRRAGLALLVALFTFFSLYNHREYLVPARAEARPRLVFAAQLASLGPIPVISYDAAHRDPELLPGMQFLLPDTVFRWFDSERGEKPESEAVISGNAWTQARRLGARFAVSSAWDNALWVLPGEMQSRLPPVSYENVPLGTAPRFGVPETGFHLPEMFLGLPGRWTSGTATLRVPVDPASPPRLLGIETIVPGRDGAHLQLLANGVELWNERIPPDPWSQTFRLEPGPPTEELLIELNSDTSGDGRSLGLVVRGIRLTSRDRRSAGAYEGVNFGPEYVLGFQESGFHLPERIKGTPGRWTNGAATLNVPLGSGAPPRRLRVETIAAGTDGAVLQVLANGVELWNQPIPPEAWSKTFSLEGVPTSGELRLELNSETFSPADSSQESRDERRLGVAVTGIRLTSGDRFEDEAPGSNDAR